MFHLILLKLFKKLIMGITRKLNIFFINRLWDNQNDPDYEINKNRSFFSLKFP